MSATGYGGLEKAVEAGETETPKVTTTKSVLGFDAVKAMSGTRILFGAIFLFDGILKWILFQQGTMQGVVQGSNVFNYAIINNDWFGFGLLVALGETFGGLALLLGFFQKPAAMWSAAIMFAIWGIGGYDGTYIAGTGWSFVGYTDPGGDLMLALVFVALIFAPTAYGLASRFHLRTKWNTNSTKHKLLRFLLA